MATENTSVLNQEAPPPTPEEKAAAEAATAAAAAAGGEQKPTDGGKDGQADDAPGSKPGEGQGDSGKPDGQQSKDDAPKAPEKYSLTLPDGSPLDDVDLAQFEAEAKALGLSQDAAQLLVTTLDEVVRATAARYLDELKADKEIGGAKFDETKTLALRGRDVLFPPGSEEADVVSGWFERTGLGNHKVLVRAFARLGRMVAEDNGVIAKGSESGEKKSTAQKMYPGMNP